MDCQRGATKHCIFNACVSDTRYGPRVDFIKFPKACLAVRKKLIACDTRHLKKCSLCQMCTRWLKLCKQPQKSVLDVNKFTHICTNHFVNKSGPSEIYPDPLPSVKALKIRNSVRNRDKPRRPINKSTETQISASVDVNCGKIPTVASAPPFNLLDNNLLCNSSNFIESDVEPIFVVAPNIAIKEDEECQPCGSFTKTKGTQTVMNAKQINKLKEKQKLLKKQIAELKEKVNKLEKPLSEKTQKVTAFVESLRKNERRCKFYTNLSFPQILALLAFLKPSNNFQYWPKKKSKCIKGKKLTHLEELVLTLVRLRSGLLVEDLSYRFNISKALISSTVITWVQHCFYKFSQIRSQMFAGRDKIKENLPAMFKRLKNIRVIIDCAEFYCESPSSFDQQGNLYSSYKAHTTFKVLIGCTPNGAVSFVSDLFEGSISDKELVKKSKLLDHLETGDLVLADRGFDIKYLTDSKKVSLNIPPFLKGRYKLTPEEELETKLIAKERIYIEHVVGRLKQFRLLKKILPIKMIGILSQMVFVCACLLNFQEPIVQGD